MEDKCVLCGDIIPEGIQVCPNCEKNDTYRRGYANGVRDFAKRIRERDKTWSISEIEKELLKNKNGMD
ncbi:MAG: hypothetical protein U0M06_05135 [Clostridia bacterium]|nr:hypothetical protein [Clostridia bacterium]